MADVRAGVHAELRARLEAVGVTTPDADALVSHLETLFLDATTLEDASGLVLPALLTEKWRPELALSITSHRGGWIGRTIVACKRRLLLPLNRWLFEYTLGNFRRQDRLNLVILACLERLAAENLRLRGELDAARRPTGSAVGNTVASAVENAAASTTAGTADDPSPSDLPPLA
jgi:hypothetical protein